MVEEIKVIDQITVTENGTLLVREATKIMKDGAELTKTFHRWSFNPGADISTMPQNVQDIANVTWTQEVIDAYQASLSQGPQ